MNCTTCGRENPPHLTFCQECGQRLGPRIAPPTPPIGLGVEVASGEGHGRGAPPPRADEPMPSRLATSLGAAASPVAHLAPPAQAAAPATHAGGARPCRVCATPNGPNLRYCTSCGTTLDAPGAQPAAAAPAPAPAASPIAAAPAPFAATALASNSPVAAVAPVRVVDLGSAPRAASDGPRICNRCRGVVDAGAQFCKFCGAPLAEAAAPAPAPAPTPAPAPHAAAALAPTPSPGLAGVAAPAPARPPTVPMQHSPSAPPPERPIDPPTPFAAFPPQHLYAQATVQPAPSAAPSQVAQAQAPQAASAYGPPPALGSAGAPVPNAPAAATAPATRPSVVRGRLVVIAKSGADGPSYPIGDTLDVGRLEGQIIVGEDPYLSPRHVRIAWTGSKMVLRDLASTNGVYIRLVAGRDMARDPAGGPGKQGRANAPAEEKVPGEVAVPLHDQDLILVGQQVLRFEIVKDGEAGFGPAIEHGTLLFGSPAAPRYARLSQRTVEGVTRDVYYVRKVETVLGRESGDVVFTEDPFLSRRHAAIRVLGLTPEAARAAASGGNTPDARAARVNPESIQFALVDLGSSNGSFLRIRNEIDLLAGDHFRVGQQLFRVDLDANAGRAS